MHVPIQFRSLSARLGTMVLVALTVFTLAIGVTAYTITGNWLEKTAVSNLEALASARQSSLEVQLRDYRDGLMAFAQPELAGEVAALVAARGAEQEALRKKLVARMWRKLGASSHNVGAKVVNLAGEVVAETFPAGGEPTERDLSVIEQGRQHLFISDPFAAGENVYLDMSMPLRNARGDTLAVLILRVSGHEILSITGDYTGLGQTGETVLGARRGEKIHFLAPLRFDPNMSQIKPAPADGERAKPMIHATAGQSGTTRAPDYRGTRVVAAYRPIALTGWGLVVKQDVAETLASVERLRTTLFIGLVLVLGGGALVTFPLIYAFTRPLRLLEQATRRVSRGDLTARVPSESKDEIGRLAESFNTMVHHLRLAHDDLARKNRELSDFAYVVSHDLKAPLRGVSSLSEWLEEGLGDNVSQEQRKQMELLRGRVLRMDGLINGLLEYSRVGRVGNPTSRVDTGSLVQSVVDAVNPPEQIHVVVAGNMPEVNADELRLAQVFQNLIENAVKYHGGPQGNVEVGCRETDGFWEFSVRDDGPGIDPRYHQRIFQIFQTLQSRDEVESTGVGLSLVKRIVEENGGTVCVESKGVPGEGTTFRFTWPKRKEETNDDKVGDNPSGGR